MLCVCVLGALSEALLMFGRSDADSYGNRKIVLMLQDAPDRYLCNFIERIREGYGAEILIMQIGTGYATRFFDCLPYVSTDRFIYNTYAAALTDANSV